MVCAKWLLAQTILVDFNKQCISLKWSENGMDLLFVLHLPFHWEEFLNLINGIIPRLYWESLSDAICMSIPFHSTVVHSTLNNQVLVEAWWTVNIKVVSCTAAQVKVSLLLLEWVSCWSHWCWYWQPGLFSWKLTHFSGLWGYVPLRLLFLKQNCPNRMGILVIFILDQEII